jgi:predicted GNAT superfamily acetyltransferase
MATAVGSAPELTRAVVEAEEAARAASVTVRALADRVECQQASDLLAKLWGTESHAAPLTGDVLVSLGHAGSCLLGAFDARDVLVGVVVGLAGAPQSSQLYSMIAGVDPDCSGRGVGLALKLAERAWALGTDADCMVWTFDPLIRRNASFNLIRLRARATDYIADFYPPMHDAVNLRDRTDRLVVEWDLVRPAPGVAGAHPGTVVLSPSEGGEPVRRAFAVDDWLVGVPSDIERTRVAAPDIAARWRLEVREVMQAGYDDGREILGFTRDGFYIVGRSR